MWWRGEAGRLGRCTYPLSLKLQPFHLVLMFILYGQRGFLWSIQRRFFAVGGIEPQHTQAASLTLSVFILLSACPKSSRKSSHLHPLTGLHHWSVGFHRRPELSLGGWKAVWWVDSALCWPQHQRRRQARGFHSSKCALASFPGKSSVRAARTLNEYSSICLWCINTLISWSECVSK